MFSLSMQTLAWQGLFQKALVTVWTSHVLEMVLLLPLPMDFGNSFAVVCLNRVALAFLVFVLALNLR
jgi:hypothetical protein